MNLHDVKKWADSEAAVFLEAYQRNQAQGHAVKYKLHRDIAAACADAIRLMDAYGIGVKDGCE